MTLNVNSNSTVSLVKYAYAEKFSKTFLIITFK